MKYEKGYRMLLGRQPPFTDNWEPFHKWLMGFYIGRYWPTTPYARFHEKVAIHRRYKPGPRPWAPGRYQTSKWQPYSGHGRFSGLADIREGAYYAERYTGVKNRPEYYIRDRSTPEQWAAHLAKDCARRSWRCAA